MCVKITLILCTLRIFVGWMILELVSNENPFVSRITGPQKENGGGGGGGGGLWNALTWSPRQNTRDQIASDRRSKHEWSIAFCVFQSFLVGVQTNAGYMRCMRNYNLEIRTTDSCRLQLRIPRLQDFIFPTYGRYIPLISRVFGPCCKLPARAINRWKKTRIRNLQCGPKKRG